MQKNFNAKNFQGPFWASKFFWAPFLARKIGINPTENHIDSLFRGKISVCFFRVPLFRPPKFSGLPFLYQAPLTSVCERSLTRWSFICENGSHSVRAWRPFSPINISKKRGLLSERAFWKWGSLGESKMWKIKRGSFSDKRFENGGQCGRTYPSHIFRECLPPPPHRMQRR